MASGDVLLAGSSVTLGQLMAILDRNDKTYTLVLKVAEPQKLQADESDEQLNVKLDMIASAHNREVAFYEFVRENAIENLSLVKYYHGTEMNVNEKKQGIIVMEDLTGRMMGEYQLGRGVGVDAVSYSILCVTHMQVF
uniref:Protein kinase domain-containing protein n=1 Tax=Steinernema glaseri TaxID=37863 RepID=A0A1I7YAU6_9BILA